MAASKADARARGRAKNETRSGSAMKSRDLLKMERKTWEQLEAHAEHIADFGGLIQQSNVGATGVVTISVGAPLEYAHDALEVSVMGRRGAVFFRAYLVGMDSLLRDEPEDDDHGDSE